MNSAEARTCAENTAETKVTAPTQYASTGTGRAVAFWITLAAAIILALVLLRAVLLPFFAGMVLAYLLDPAATWLERHGMKRLFATLIIVGIFFGCIAVFFMFAAPHIVRELAHLAESAPGYVSKLQGLASDPNRPWISKILGEGFGHAQQSLGELTALAGGWFETILRSV